MTRVLVWPLQPPSQPHCVSLESGDNQSFMFVSPSATSPVPDVEWVPCGSEINWVACFRKIYL